MEIAANTLCPCEACAQVGSLRLKFVAHAGEVAEQRIRNRTNLVGLEEITVHRMLKNSVKSGCRISLAAKRQTFPRIPTWS